MSKSGFDLGLDVFLIVSFDAVVSDFKVFVFAVDEDKGQKFIPSNSEDFFDYIRICFLAEILCNIKAIKAMGGYSLGIVI